MWLPYIGQHLKGLQDRLADKQMMEKVSLRRPAYANGTKKNFSLSLEVLLIAAEALAKMHKDLHNTMTSYIRKSRPTEKQCSVAASGINLLPQGF